MSAVTIKDDGKPSVNKREAFCEALSNQIPDPNTPITDILKNIDNYVKNENNTVTKDALKNCHGDWYEWLLAISAWNISLQFGYSKRVFSLPKISSYFVEDLYEDKVCSLIKDLKQKLETKSDINLVSSNPDFVIIDTTNIDLAADLGTRIKAITPEKLVLLNSAYKGFDKKCTFSDLIGYISVKTSFRSDRRFQIVHEGSLMKALYVHIQTRDWIINPQGLKYFAIATKASNADLAALKTVATHSITTVQSPPQRAVDEVYVVNTLQTANEVFNTILS